MLSGWLAASIVEAAIARLNRDPNCFHHQGTKTPRRIGFEGMGNANGSRAVGGRLGIPQ